MPDDQIKNNNYLYIKNTNQLPYCGYGLSSLYLTDDNIQKYVDEIQKLKPAFIRGYPSFVYRIAKYIKDNGIVLDFEIKMVEITSESSFDYQRRLISSVFNTKVVMQYGHTEACAFGYTIDDNYKYRIEPLYGYVEVIKENGKHAEKGEVGEIVVTSLHNFAMPLIRYKTGDYAVFDGYDGRVMILQEIMGRTQDYIVNKYGNKVLLTALIFAQHFNALGHMDRWQIEQFEKGIVLISIVKGRDFSSKDEDEIKQLFNKVGDVDVVFDYSGQIRITGRGKSMMLIQHIIF